MKNKLFSSLLLTLALVCVPSVSAAPSGNYVDASGGYIAATLPIASAPSSVSFSAWIKPDKTNGTQKIFVSGDTTSNTTTYDFSLSGSSITLKVNHGNGSQTILSAGSIQAATWTQVGFNLSPTATVLSINGSQVISHAGLSGLRMLGPSIGIARQSFDSFFGGGQFTGSVDEVVLEKDNQPLIIWHLDGSRGELTAPDVSGNGNTGTLTGGDFGIHYHGDQPQQALPPVFTFPRPTWVLPTIVMLPVETDIPQLPGRITPMPMPTIAWPTQAPIPVGDIESSFPQFDRGTRSFRVQI